MDVVDNNHNRSPPGSIIHRGCGQLGEICLDAALEAGYRSAGSAEPSSGNDPAENERQPNEGDAIGSLIKDHACVVEEDHDHTNGEK